MSYQTNVDPWWAAFTVWVVVNSVNVLQGLGFLSRIRTGGMAINHLLGWVMIGLAVPSAVALAAFLRTGAGWLQWAGPALYIVFIGFMVAVDYIHPVEFRSPVRSEILIPFLVLFFGSILLMGLPMYRSNRNLWLITVITTVFLLVSMIAAIRKGVA